MHRCDTQPPHSVWDQLKYTSLLTILFFLIIINSHTRSVIQSDRHQIHRMQKLRVLLPSEHLSQELNSDQQILRNLLSFRSTLPSHDDDWLQFLFRQLFQFLSRWAVRCVDKQWQLANCTIVHSRRSQLLTIRLCTSDDYKFGGLGTWRDLHLAAGYAFLSRFCQCSIGGGHSAATNG